jgi:hypothetical protein
MQFDGENDIASHKNAVILKFVYLIYEILYFEICRQYGSWM